jgi:hypothetical protein
VTVELVVLLVAGVAVFGGFTSPADHVPVYVFVLVVFVDDPVKASSLACSQLWIKVTKPIE